ncbi:MAG: energy transducer TonB [Bacteroidales bacterium]|nr:energy transducer TonB [Bacteroidales bacterium]
MAKGKQTCKILKEIRKQIAEENDIELVVSECTYQGDCLGTCPKCESEVRYLERELEKRQRLGKAAVIAGMSLGTLISAAACDTTENTTSKSCPGERLTGDVVAITPEVQDPDTIIESDLMGIFPMYRAQYAFDNQTYKNLLQTKFVFPKMKNLSVISGEIEYEHARRGKACESLEELAEAAIEFRAPYYSEGEQDLLTVLSLQSQADVSNYRGEMEVAFTVDVIGSVSDVEVVKGIDKTLDDAIVAAFKQMKWHPAYYQLKDEYESMPFECRCVQKILFPVEVEPVLLEGEPPIPIEDMDKQ